jgi:hypothetical protein
MCEFLVKAIDATHKDPEKDRGGCYKRGDPICCLPDGSEWGKHDGPPLAEIIKFPGMSVEEGLKYVEVEWGEVPGEKHKPYRRRRFSFDLDNIGKTTNFETARTYIKEKSTGKTE